MNKNIASASESIQKLFQHAFAARENAYAPYSGHKVGAALLLSQGTIFSGCNIENSSFGATLCAERVAIHQAISQLGQIEMIEIMVLTQAKLPWPPCGMCLQVMKEFAHQLFIHTANLLGNFHTYTLQELLPVAFTSTHLKL